MENQPLAVLKKAHPYKKADAIDKMGQRAAAEAMWQGFREGQWGASESHPEARTAERECLIKHPEPAAIDDLWRLFELLAQDPATGHHIEGWPSAIGQVFERAIVVDKAAVVARIAQMGDGHREQLEYELALAGDSAAMSDAAWDTLIKTLLRAWNLSSYARWATKREIFAKLPLEKFAAAFSRNIGREPTFRNWDLYSLVRPLLSDATKVATLVRYNGEKPIERLVSTIDEVSSPRGLFEAHLSDEKPHYAAFALAHLHVEAGEAVPDELIAHFATYQASENGSEHESRVFGAMAPEKIAPILTVSLNSKRALIPYVSSDDLIDAALASKNSAFAPHIARAGARALPALKKAAAKGKPVALMECVIAATALIRTPESAEVLASLLGHKSKAVRGAAFSALQDFGELARAALEGGAREGTADLVDGCRELLAHLPEAKETAIGSVLDRIEAEAEEDAAVVLIEAMPPVVDGTMKGLMSYVDASLRSHGSLAILALREFFVESIPNANRSDASGHAWSILWQLVRVATGGAEPKYAGLEEEEGDRIAYVVLDVVARLPKLREYDAGQLQEECERYQREWRENMGLGYDERFADAAFLALKTHPATPQDAVLLRIAGEVPEKTWPVLVAGLEHKSKAVRTFCTEALGRAPASASEVLPLLSARKKDARLAAAKVLAAHANSDVVEALQTARAAEKSEAVVFALEDALAACGAL